MTTLRTKVIEMVRNLTSDAVPQTPRRTSTDTITDVSDVVTENITFPHEEDTITEPEPEDLKKGHSPDPKYPKYKKRSNFFSKPKKDEKKDKLNHSINIQATGNVISIVNSNGIHWGPTVVNNFGPNNGKKNKDNQQQPKIKKSQEITLLMGATVQPEHKYLSYISNNLGNNWHNFFLALGYTKGRIETVELNTSKKGVVEARYQLLLEWVRNDEDGSLGRLATLLWDEGEKEIVQELAQMYKIIDK